MTVVYMFAPTMQFPWHILPNMNCVLFAEVAGVRLQTVGAIRV